MEIYLSPPAALCCAGNGREAFFDAAIRGDQSGIRPQVIGGNRHFVTGRIAEPPVSVAAPACMPGAEAPPPEYAGQTRIFRITAAALEQIRPAVEKVLTVYGKEKIGVCVGSCDNGSEASTLAHRAFFGGEGFPSNYELRFQGASFLAEYISRALGITGPAITVSTACASSAGAIVKGAEFIRAGICDAVIAGGVDIASDTVLLGFSALEAVSGTV
ncbi:MAG: 3-oxoacyl-ACP synthase, partial [Treponema sp.]|nr:3-oxoacyl-ACP synthase [Treponema sp.]